MRQLTDHIVSGDQAVQLQISVLDEPGAGGACHLYQIDGMDRTTNPSYQLLCEALAADPTKNRGWVMFQNGPIKEFGVNGATQEALLAIVIDRLRSFQAGPFACEANEFAMVHCQQALAMLQKRTRERIARGVEGTNQK